MERCPSAFAYYDPAADKVHYVPVCAWSLHKTEAMKKIADHYSGQAQPGDTPTV